MLLAVNAGILAGSFQSTSHQIVRFPFLPLELQVVNQACQKNRTVKQLHNCLLMLSILLIARSSLQAITISEVVFFGDSLSDIGNTSSWSLGFVPGSAYWNGRFSNGPVFSERLSVKLGQGTLASSTAGGNNYAYGGAQTTGTGGVNGWLIDDLDEQVDDFLENQTAGAETLFVVLAGSNDFLNSSQTNVSATVANIAEDLTRLHAAGARQMLVLNLPRLGDTPRFNGSVSLSNTMNARTDNFNHQLAVTLDGLSENLADLVLVQYDLASLFQEVLSTPGQYGLTNVTSPAAPGLDAGDLFYSSGNVVSNPEDYLFWDEIHPTTTGHALVAQDIFDTLESFDPNGDFDNSGIVDAADYTLWQDHLGLNSSVLNGHGSGASTVLQVDYQLWDTHFGEIVANGSQANRIPEPASILLALCALTACRWARTMNR